MIEVLRELIEWLWEQDEADLTAADITDREVAWWAFCCDIVTCDEYARILVQELGYTVIGQ